MVDGVVGSVSVSLRRPTMTKKRRIAASSSIAVLASLGLIFYVQVGDLNLASYMQNYTLIVDDATEYQSNPKQYRRSRRRERREREFDDGDDEDSEVKDDNPARISSNTFHTKHTKIKSPACHPHFQSASFNNNATKFKRMYFYHARKAGGTSMANYLAMVARHHGLEFQHDEWVEAEEPGTHDMETFYVTHLREPVSMYWWRRARKVLH